MSTPALRTGVPATHMCSMPTLPADGGRPIYNPIWVGKDKIGDGHVLNHLFGDATYNAVKYWQEKNGLDDDGKFGPITSARMKKVRGK